MLLILFRGGAPVIVGDSVGTPDKWVTAPFRGQTPTAPVRGKTPTAPKT